MDSFLKRGDEILSVTEFSARFKRLVKTRVPELWLRGEVSNCKRYPSGHVYFTLKDEGASISAVMFKGFARGAEARLKDGARLLVYGEIGVYEARGNYQIVVKAVLEDGAGELAERFEALKKKLSEEGIFDADKKRDIPLFPRRLAVITSPSGAAIRDFVSILRRRGWRGEVVIFPSKVQGEAAAAEIVSQIEKAQMMGGFDLLILMRGGGSLEDLWCFNEEIVARAVASCALPTISAVGHEVDFSLSDFAADLRAETPSAAAELVSSNYLDLLDSLSGVWESIVSEVEGRLERCENSLALCAQNLKANSPRSRVENLSIRLDELSARLEAEKKIGMRGKLADYGHAIARFKGAGVKARVEMAAQRLTHCAQKLENLSFESTLRRGYAAVYDAKGESVSSASSLQAGQEIKIRFSDGDSGAFVK